MAQEAKARAPLRFPKKLGACIDLAYTLRAERLEYQREVEEELARLKAAEKAINDHIINTFNKSEIEGARGEICSASIGKAVYPKVVDWDKVYLYIKKTGEFDIMERRMAKAAFRERYEAGVMIPGTEVYEEISLSLTKVGSKK